jgi:hypothetical protein
MAVHQLPSVRILPSGCITATSSLEKGFARFEGYARRFGKFLHPLTLPTAVIAHRNSMQRQYQICIVAENTSLIDILCKHRGAQPAGLLLTRLL